MNSGWRSGGESRWRWREGVGCELWNGCVELWPCRVVEVVSKDNGRDVLPRPLCLEKVDRRLSAPLARPLSV